MLFADGATVPQGRFIQPRIEAEIAFVMKAPLQGPEVTRDDVLAATDHVAPALEILDTRILRADPATRQGPHHHRHGQRQCRQCGDRAGRAAPCDRRLSICAGSGPS